MTPGLRYTGRSRRLYDALPQAHKGGEVDPARSRPERRTRVEVMKRERERGRERERELHTILLAVAQGMYCKVNNYFADFYLEETVLKMTSLT